jgi:hypothetical protein
VVEHNVDQQIQVDLEVEDQVGLKELVEQEIVHHHKSSTRKFWRNRNFTNPAPVSGSGGGGGATAGRIK